MKTSLPLSKKTSSAFTFIGKLSFAIFVVLFCYGNSLYAGVTPVAKHKPGRATPGKSIAKRLKPFSAPSIDYGFPQHYVINHAISPLTPTSSGVGVPGYSGAVPVALGSGFSTPSAVALDKAGNIYVTDYGNNLIKMMPSGGGASTNISSGFTHPTAIAIDTTGNIFITQEGSASVYEIVKSTHTLTTIGSGFDTPMGLATDVAGNVYVADAGPNINKVFKIPVGGGAPVSIGTGFNTPYAVAVDNAGNIYVADRDNNAIKKIAAVGGATTAVTTGLNGPTGVAVDAIGNIFIADNGNNAIKMKPVSGAVVSIGSGFSLPNGVAVDAFGNVIVADYGNNAIEQVLPTGGYYISPALPAGLSFSNSTGIISGTPTVVGPTANYSVKAYNSEGSTAAVLTITVHALSITYPGNPAAYAYNEGLAITPLTPTVIGTVAAPGYSTTLVSKASGFSSVRGVATDAAGNIYVADFVGSKIKKIPAGGGSPVIIGTGFTNPDGVAVDGAGNVYVADYGNGLIKKINIVGGTTVTIATLSNPYGIAADAAGNVFVADYNNHVIKKIPADGGATVSLGTGFLSAPAGVAVDAAGNVFVADFATSLIKELPVGGGTPITLGSGFSNPYGVSVDPSGNVFVADYSHGAVKEIPVGGGATITLASGFGVLTGVAPGPDGILYTADYNSASLNQISPVGGYYIGGLPVGLGFNNATGVVSGTPSAITPATNYTVTAYNILGSNSTSINIQVNALAISYNSSPVTATAGIAIAAINPTSSAVAALAYNNTPVTVGATGLSGPNSVAFNAAGDMYVSDAGNSTVKKFPAGGGAAVTVSSSINTSGLALDAAGNLYVLDYANNAIKKFPAGIGPPQTLITGLNQPYGIAIDGHGNIFVADKGSGWIKELTPGAAFTSNYSSNYGPPTCVATDAAGNVYMGSTGSGPIKMIPAGGGAIVSLGSGFTNPAGIVVDAAGNIYVSEQGSTMNSGTVKEIRAGDGSTITLSTGFNNQQGITIDTKGSLYIADYNNHAIKQLIPAGGYFINALPLGLKFDRATGIITGTPTAATPATNYMVTAYNNFGSNAALVNITVNLPPIPTVSYSSPQKYVINTPVTPQNPGGSNVLANFSYSNTPVTLTAALNRPNSIAIDAMGNTYVSNSGNSSVQKIPAGGGAPVFINSGALNPGGVAVDAAGNIYVGDFGNNAVKKVPVGGGAAVAIGTGFSGPTGVAVDAAGNVYVADFNNSAVKEILAAGGSTITLGSGFNHPNGVAVDAAGNVYVADAFNGAVKMIPVGGGAVVTLVSGLLGPYGVAVDASGNVFVAERDNSAIDEIPAGGGAKFTIGANFNSPYGVVVDAKGNIYVADFFNNAAKEIMPVGGYYINPALPVGLGFDKNTGIISGTPTMLSPAANYTITGYNYAGSGSAIVNVSVNQFPPPVISYGSAKNYSVNTAITPLAPANSGGPVDVPGYNSSPLTLGSGFSLPTDVAVDIAGNVYVADRSNNAVKKIPVGGGTPIILGSGFNSPAGVAVDNAGNVYVSDEGNSLVKKIPVGGGAITNLGTGFSNPFGIAVDGAGNVYVADYSNNAVKKIPAGSNVPVIIGSGFTSPIDVAVDSRGNVYVADYGGNAVKMIPVGGGAIVTLGSGFLSPSTVAVDAEGNVFVGDDLNNAVKEIPAGGGAIITIGSGFHTPFGLTLDGAGNVYVADYLNSAVKKITPAGGYFINALPAGLSFDNSTGVLSGTPVSVNPATDYTITAYNSTGGDAATVNIAISPPAPPSISYTSPHTYSTGGAIAALSPTNSGGAVPATIYSDVSTLAGSGAAGSANGTGAAATFTGLMNMATDVAGNIYAADYTANVIRKITPAGVATTLAGSGAAGNANGTGAAATFKNPFGIAVDAMGNVYVGDSGNHLIRKITPAGVVTTFAGSGGTGNVNGTGTAAKFNVPRGLAFDGAGNLYVADYSNNLVRKITAAGVVTTLAGSGTAGNVNGTGTAASFSGPMAVTTDGTGNVYVADNANNLIRKITPGGGVTTLAGSGAAGSVNGTGTAASFTGPYALTTDGANNIYEADGQLLRKITPAGVTTTLAGSVSGLVNAAGTAARFNNPRGIATDDMGNLYVSDFTNHVVRKVLLTGYTISPALPAGLAFDSATGIISGTPTAASAATNFTVMAYNATGSDAATVNITVTANILPNITYTTPHSYPTGSAIAALSPTNTGSAIPATIYSNVSTLAGSGTAGSANGTGAAATFTGLMNMATDAAGNIYAADYTANVIRKITPAGVATTLAGSGAAGNANGTGAAATFKTPFGIAVDAMGNVYVGDSGNHLIRKITPAGVVTTFAGSGGAGNVNGTGTAAKFNVPRGLAFDGAGDLYVADYSNNLIRKITPAGVVTTLAGSGAAGNVNAMGTSASFSGPMAVTTDGAGNVYVADNSNNLIRKITPAGAVTTLAGSGAAGSVNGTGTAASFTGPYALTTDGANNIYEADGQLLRKITAAGVTTTLAGSVSGLVNGAGTAARFNNPRGIATDDMGNLYVSDFTNHVVRKVLLTGYAVSPALPAGLAFNSATGTINGTPTAASAATDYTVTAYNTSGSDAATVNITVTSNIQPNISYTTPHTYSTGSAIAALSPTNTGSAVPATIYSNVSTLAGSGTAGSANGTGAAATFTGLMNMTTDAAGNIYAADYTANVIRKITPAGVATTLAGSGMAGNANGTGTAATFKNPFGIAVDAMGNVYVGDSGNHLIRKITPGGIVTTFAGSGGTGNVNGTGTAAKFNVPRGLAFDGAGNLYVADYSNNLVRKITPAGVVTTLAGSGTAGNVNGMGTSASFSGPIAVTTDGAGNVYVADNTNNLIRKITSAGAVTTLAGSGAAGSENGTGTAASFTGPYALTTDGANNIYEADGQLLRKITPAGVTTTLAGSVSGLVNGAGTAARFNNPRGIATDDMGNLYVSDFTNHVVRKVLLTGYTISPVLPAGLAFNSATGTISGTPTAAVAATNYTVTAYNAIGSDVATVNITTTTTPGFAAIVTETPLEETAGAPQVKQGISPNGDGIGDVLEIANIGNYPENTFEVISRSGALIYSIKGYDNVSKAFDGHSNINGKLQQAGTYFYQLEYNDKGKLKRKTGFILLKY